MKKVLVFTIIFSCLLSLPIYAQISYEEYIPKILPENTVLFGSLKNPIELLNSLRFSKIFNEKITRNLQKQLKSTLEQANTILQFMLRKQVPSLLSVLKNIRGIYFSVSNVKSKVPPDIFATIQININEDLKKFLNEYTKTIKVKKEFLNLNIYSIKVQRNLYVNFVIRNDVIFLTLSSRNYTFMIDMLNEKYSSKSLSKNKYFKKFYKKFKNSSVYLFINNHKDLTNFFFKMLRFSETLKANYMRYVKVNEIMGGGIAIDWKTDSVLKMMLYFKRNSSLYKMFNIGKTQGEILKFIPDDTLGFASVSLDKIYNKWISLGDIFLNFKYSITGFRDIAEIFASDEKFKRKIGYTVKDIINLIGKEALLFFPKKFKFPTIIVKFKDIGSAFNIFQTLMEKSKDVFKTDSYNNRMIFYIKSRREPQAFTFIDDYMIRTDTLDDMKKVLDTYKNNNHKRIKKKFHIQNKYSITINALENFLIKLMDIDKKYLKYIKKYKYQINFKTFDEYVTIKFNLGLNDILQAILLLGVYNISDLEESNTE